MANKKKIDKVAANAQKAKDKAYGKENVEFANYRSYGKASKADIKNNAKQNKIMSISASGTSKPKVTDTGKTAKTDLFAAKVYNANISKVDSDAYDILKKKAKAAGLTGQEATNAIEKALKVVSRRMKSDRSRTATRTSAIQKRESKKRSNTDLS